jgi:hypothetical protein
MVGVTKTARIGRRRAFGERLDRDPLLVDGDADHLRAHASKPARCK